MKIHAAIVALLVAATPAVAAVTVIGSSPARDCYLGAVQEARGVGALGQCDLALDSGVLKPSDLVATHVNRGILRMFSGDASGAVADYDAAIALDEAQAEAWLNKGLALLRTGGARDAVSLFDAAIARRTREPAIAHFGRAMAHEEAGNLRAAYADLVRARELSPRWSAPAAELKRFQVRRD